jgi:hypothetical protein
MPGILLHKAAPHSTCKTCLDDGIYYDGWEDVYCECDAGLALAAKDKWITFSTKATASVRKRRKQPRRKNNT